MSNLRFKILLQFVTHIVAFQIVLEALPKDETNQGRRYRGYVAIDNLVFEDGDVRRISLLH